MGFSVPHLLVVLAIVVLVFGTKRLKNVGGDLGEAIKGFRNAVKDGEQGDVLVNKDDKTLDDVVIQQKQSSV